MAASVVSAVVPETSKLLKYVGQLLQSSLDEKAFNTLKWMSRKNNFLIQGLFSWSAIQKDIAAGISPKVAIGSEAALFTFNLGASWLLAGAAGAVGLTATAPAAVAASIIIGVGVAIGSDRFGFKGWAAELIDDALSNVDAMFIDHPSSVDDVSSDHHTPSAGSDLDMSFQPVVYALMQPSAPSADDGLTQFSDYQIYLAMREIIEHPEAYPDAAAILPDILSSIADAIPPEDLAGVDPVDGDSSLRSPPETVRYVAIEPDNGLKIYVVDDDRSYLFVGDDTPNKMVGGKAINWFMPKTDHGGANTVIGNPDGYIVSGDIIFKGKKQRFNHPSDAIRAGLAYATEDRKGNGLVLIKSIQENISLANLQKVSRNGVINEELDKQTAMNFVDSLSIKTPGIHQLVMNLSGGNQQKVSVAKWLFVEPDVLIFDEPTRGIDVGAKYEIYTIINDLVSKGMSIVMISSELPEILGMSDRIYVVANGTITGELDGKSATQEVIMQLATQY